MKYSFIVPVYNRPDEIKELLESLVQLPIKNFEVIVVEDGSTVSSEQIVNDFKPALNIHYHFKENAGQGFARNYGMERASGDYFIILDSDCIIPPHYLSAVQKALDYHQYDIYGGPDAAHPSFTDVQKAISYSMTSFLTTGGIRGRKNKVVKFYPRSFNMGVSREVYEKAGGFKITRMGEDIEWSMRIIKLGFKSGLIEEAYVYHKRRTDLKRFFKQIFYFGRARINIASFFPGTLKLIHFLPVFFSLGFLAGIFLLLVYPMIGLPIILMYLVYSLAIFIDSWLKNRSISVATLSVITSWIQMTAYGSGLIYEWWRRNIQGRNQHLEYYPE